MEHVGLSAREKSIGGAIVNASFKIHKAFALGLLGKV